MGCYLSARQLCPLQLIQKQRGGVVPGLAYAGHKRGAERLGLSGRKIDRLAGSHKHNAAVLHALRRNEFQRLARFA